MAAEAATFGVASYLHSGGHIVLGFAVIYGERFSAAATPEAVIGAVLAVAAVIVVAGAPRARQAACVAIGFAILGVIVGLTVLLSETRPSITADLAYHAAILAALLGTLAAILRRGSGGGGRPTWL
jgi:hypothetical protein